MRIGEEIIGLIEEAKPAPGPITPASNLYTDIGLDSLTFVQLLLKIEETYNITFDLMEMGACLQVERLIALVEHKVRENS